MKYTKEMIESDVKTIVTIIAAILAVWLVAQAANTMALSNRPTIAATLRPTQPTVVATFHTSLPVQGSSPYLQGSSPDLQGN